MNQMSVELGYDDEAHEYPQFVFILDGFKTEYVINPVYLEVSLQADGVYYDMLECVCGGGDNNYEILSRRRKDTIVWELVRYTLGKKIEKKFEGMVWTETHKKFSDQPLFPPTFYISNIQEVVNQMRSFFQENGNLERHDAEVKGELAFEIKNGKQKIQKFQKKYEEQDEPEIEIGLGGPIGSIEERFFESHILGSKSWADLLSTLRSVGFLRKAEREKSSLREVIQSIKNAKNDPSLIEKVPKFFSIRKKVRELLETSPNEPERTDFHFSNYPDTALTEVELLLKKKEVEEERAFQDVMKAYRTLESGFKRKPEFKEVVDICRKFEKLEPRLYVGGRMVNKEPLSIEQITKMYKKITK